MSKHFKIQMYNRKNIPRIEYRWNSGSETSFGFLDVSCLQMSTLYLCVCLAVGEHFPVTALDTVTQPFYQRTWLAFPLLFGSRELTQHCV